MKIRLELVFEGVDPQSERGLQIENEVLEACETMRIAFDAEEILVDTNVGDEE